MSGSHLAPSGWTAHAFNGNAAYYREGGETLVQIRTEQINKPGTAHRKLGWFVYRPDGRAIVVDGTRLMARSMPLAKDIAERWVRRCKESA